MATLTRTLTHAELLAKITAGTLHKGESITISDYRTVHTIPNTTDTNTGDLEPLLVTAISNNELKPEAYSALFPDDIIYYNAANDETIVPGCTKGLIYRRIDTKQANDFPFDFRQVKFRRWQINAPDWLVGTTYSKGNVVQKPTTTELYISIVGSNTGNNVSDEIYWRRFEWDNGVYVSWSETNWTILDDAFTISIPCTALYNDYHFFADSDYLTHYSNTIDSSFTNIILSNNTVVFGTYFSSNSIGANFSSNSIGTNFYSNSIGANFSSNSIGANFYYNSIGTNFSSNSIRAYFSSNSIGTNFYSNSIGTYFNYNSIGTNFNANSIGAYFNSNSIGANFNYNSIEAYFNYNSIGANFSSNSIGANFNYNSIEAYFYSNSIGTYFNYNSIGANFYYNSIGTYFSSNSIGANFQQNTIADQFNNCAGTLTGVDFTLETHVNQTYTCELFTNSLGLPRLRYFDNNDVQQIVILTQITP